MTFGKRIHPILLLVGLVCLTSIFLQLWLTNDDHVLDDLTQSFEPSALLQSYLLEHPEYTIDDVNAGMSTFEGVRYESSAFVLYPTAYELHLRYELTLPTGLGAWEGFSFRDSLSINEDNSDHATIASIALQTCDDALTTILYEWESPKEYSYAIACISLPADAVFSLQDVYLISSDPYFSDAFLTLLFVCALLMMVWFLLTRAHSIHHQMTSQKQKTTWMFVACALLSVLSCLPLLGQGLTRTHDMAFHLSRIEGLRMCLTEGIFPMQMNPYSYSQYGYPDGIYYPSLFLLFPACLRILHASPMMAYKALCIAIHMGTALIACFVGLHLSKSRKIGLLFGVLYTFALYRLANIYSRAAIGESLAMMFVPLAFYGMHQLFFASSKRKSLPLAIGMAGIIHSHVASVLMTSILLALYALCHWRLLLKKDTLVSLLKAVLLTFGLCAFWLVPFLGWLPYDLVYSSSDSIASHAAQFSQLFHHFVFSPLSTSLPLADGTQSEMPLSIGLLMMFGVSLFAYFRFARTHAYAKLSRSLRAFLDFCLIGFAFTLFASSSLFPYTLCSQIPVLSLISSIQFPWRFLSLASFFGGILTALSIWLLTSSLPSEKQNIACLLASFLVIFSSMPYLESAVSDLPNDYANSSSSIYGYGDYLYLPNDIVDMYNRRDNLSPFLQCEDDSVVFTDCQRGLLTLSFSFENSSLQAQEISVPFFNYPNLCATMDGEPLSYTQNDFGQVVLLIDQGVSSGVVQVCFVSFWYYPIGYALTILTCLFLLLYFVKKRKP